MAIGWTETSSASTASPRLTSSMKRLSDNDIVMRTRSSLKVSTPILKQDQCNRENFWPSADALVSFQRDQGKAVPQIPLHLMTRQHSTLDPLVQQHLEWLSFNWQQHFSSSSSSTWTESSTSWSSQHWRDAQQLREWHPAEWQDQKWWDKW